MTPTKTVRNAFDNDLDYFHKCCEQRSTAGQGSRFPRLSPDRVAGLMRNLEWEPYTHSAVEPPAQAFIARSVPGIMGMVHIDDVPENADLCWSDPKETGYSECVWQTPALHGHPVDFVVALIGPEGDLWTFFPGDPVQPSTVERGKGPVTRETAKALGIQWVKLG